MGGGRPFRCPPPSPRIAPLFRRLAVAAAAAALPGNFDVTLEATHHGPWVETPSLFAEIGSTEVEWQRSDAAHLWAAVLADELRLDSGGGGEWWDRQGIDGGAQPVLHRSSGNTGCRPVVAVGLGGGHYAPRHGDLIRRSPAATARSGKKSEVYLGHVAASYAML